MFTEGNCHERTQGAQSRNKRKLQPQFSRVTQISERGKRQQASREAEWIKEVAKRDGLDGRNGPDGHDNKTLHSATSTVSTSSMASIYSELVANVVLVLIAVACSLLDRQVAAQAKDFLEEGGFTERLYRVRSAQRRRPPGANRRSTGKARLVPLRRGPCAEPASPDLW